MAGTNVKLCFVSALLLGPTPTAEFADGRASLPILVGLVGLVICLMLAIRFWFVLRVHRRQIAHLMARLDEAETGNSSSAPSVASTANLDQSAVSDIRPEVDVLAGRTSYVATMVEGAGADAVTLADRTIVRIHANLDQVYLPSNLAKELNISLRTLERVLSAALECTPGQLIMTIKMREARRLLLSGKYRISEVAYRLGFSSPAHFSTRYKKFYAIAPSKTVRQEQQ